MKKGLHVARALLPEVQIKSCWWCGGELRRGSWVGVYRPKLAQPVHGDPQLCWDCAHRCSALAGQPSVPYHFDATGGRVTVFENDGS